MTAHPLPKDKSLSQYLSKFRFIDSACRSLLLKNLKQLQGGSICIEDFTGQEIKQFIVGDINIGNQIKVCVHRSSFYSRTVLGGSIGNAESYIDGDWETNELTDIIRLFVSNRDVLNALDSGLGNIFRPFQKFFHGLRNNTIKGSRENIRSHYDIGNDFFKLFLDNTMMYSSALFDHSNTSLEDASIKKIKTICEKLDLKKDDHLLEIGAGWGSFAIYAATHYGCHVTTTTISTEQFQYASEKIKSLGLQSKITILFEDYRNLTGSYDKLVSIEMIEAVGLKNLKTYFKKCSSLLKDDGIMVLQAITIRDHFYENAKREVDFIQRHIFPGSGIPCISAMMAEIKDHTDMILIEQEDYAEDYAHTLWHWSKNLKRHEDEIIKLGYPSFLSRLWQYYFSYCEGGFRERSIGLSQMILAKNNYRNRRLL